ncbi:MAG: M23 family metallopeptidase [Gemmatimonadaceae bacterium]
MRKNYSPIGAFAFLTLSFTSGARVIEAQQARAAIVESLDARVPVAPTVSRISGRDVLVYELHLTNTRSDTVRLRRVRVFDAGPDARLLSDLSDSSLAQHVQALQRGPSRDLTTTLAPGITRVFHAWIALPANGRSGDGIIVSTVDDSPDRDDSKPRVRLAIAQTSGNHLVPSLGSSRYAFYEHLVSHTLRVHAGQRVKTGEALARLGASGSTSIGPHLHFHVADSSATLGAEGMPLAFHSFLELGTFANINGAVSGSRWTPTTSPSGRGMSRRGEFPAPNSVIIFP